MAPKRWATKEQQAFLESYFLKYVHHQSGNSLTTFWSIFEQKWFKEFPVTSESGDIQPADIAKQKKRIKEWFQNKSQAMKRGLKTGSLALDLGPEKKAPRAPRVLEEYSRSCYKSKIEPNVKLKLGEMDNRPRHPIKLISDEIKASWEQEPEEVQRDIINRTEQKIKEMKAQESDEHPMIRSAEVLASNIRGIPHFMTKLGASLRDQTGWVWTILGGGPDPNFADGRVRTVAFNFGKNAIDHSFKAAHDQWQDHVLVPFLSFAESCFSPEECASRAVGAHTASTSDTAKDKDKEEGGISDFEDEDDKDDGDSIDYSFLHPDLRPGAKQSLTSSTPAPSAVTVPLKASPVASADPGLRDNDNISPRSPAPTSPPHDSSPPNPPPSSPPHDSSPPNPPPSSPPHDSSPPNPPPSSPPHNSTPCSPPPPPLPPSPTHATTVSQKDVALSMRATQDGYIFPTELFASGSEPHVARDSSDEERTREANPSPRDGTLESPHSPEQESGEWNTIIEGLKKRPTRGKPNNQPAKKPKNEQPNKRTRSARNPTPQPEILQEKRIRKRREAGEVVPLTVDALRKPLYDPPKKKRSNKENRCVDGVMGGVLIPKNKQKCE
ncbi:hypothetical protein H0H93_007957 [Arthromyces matolae]|nr:hypothetical protein H0H93_007957 [Arthromyces matolae]